MAATQARQPDRIFTSLKCELMWVNNTFLSWQSVFGMTFHPLQKRKCNLISKASETLSETLSEQEEIKPLLLKLLQFN